MFKYTLASNEETIDRANGVYPVIQGRTYQLYISGISNPDCIVEISGYDEEHIMGKDSMIIINDLIFNEDTLLDIKIYKQLHYTKPIPIYHWCHKCLCLDCDDNGKLMNPEILNQPTPPTHSNKIIESHSIYVQV